MMLRGLQMPLSRKIGLAALFLIAITDIVFDVTRTVYTVDGGAVALDTIWDILEAIIAVIVSSLPTYKALLGPMKRRKGSSYKNMKHNDTATLNGTGTRNTEHSDEIELGINAEHVSKKVRGNDIQEASEDEIDTTNFV